jgi:DNA gyrase inhibitor GyrI
MTSLSMKMGGLFYSTFVTYLARETLNMQGEIGVKTIEGGKYALFLYQDY